MSKILKSLLTIRSEEVKQTLAVVLASFLFSGVTILGNVILFCLLFTPFAFIPLLYQIWMYYDRETPFKGGRPWHWYKRHPIWRHYRDYFPAKLHKTTDLDPNKNYILGYHPHGILCTGAVTTLALNTNDFEQLFPGLKIIVGSLNINFWIPIFREWWLANGAVSVDKESLDYMMSSMGKGNLVTIMPGGAAEALDAVPNTMELTLKSRKGFVRLAIQYGVPLIPCLCFGENDLYVVKRFPPSSKVYKVQQILKKWFTFSTPFFYGRGLFGFPIGTFPFRKPLNVVVGRPIEVQQSPSPSREEVEKVHSLYVDALVTLFNENKAKYADPNMQIVIK